MDEIILGDCFDVMPTLPKGKIDLCICSPPYRANKEYEDKISIQQYTDFARKWTSYIPNLLTDRGQFWLNVGYTKVGPNSTLPLTYLYYPLIDLDFIQEIVWHYEGGMAYKKRFTHRTERWMWYAKDQNDIVFNLDSVRLDPSLNARYDKRNNPLGKNPTDHWYFDRVAFGGKDKTSHPCQYPLSMIERIILACSNEGDTVFDPFSGSGTTALAAKKLKRKYIGIEKNKDYYEASLKRINKEEEIFT